MEISYMLKENVVKIFLVIPVSLKFIFTVVITSYHKNSQKSYLLNGKPGGNYLLMIRNPFLIYYTYILLVAGHQAVG